MAEFSPKTFDYKNINNGQRYQDGDSVSAEAINAPIEAAALLQNLATNQPDASQARYVGTPTVEIGGTESNPKFVFKNLKGDKGDKGNIGPRGASGTSAVLENENHDSDIDGYTQNFVNSNFSNPNLLINGDFSVNQRGLSLYAMKDAAYARQYTVDRWYIAGAAGTDKGNLAVEEDGVVFTSNIQYGEFGQVIEDYKLLRGKTVTLSCKVSNANQPFRLLAYSGQTQLASYNIESEVASVTFTIPNDIQNLRVLINSRTAESSSIKIHYVKLEVGSVATPNIPKAYAQELAICTRYYQKVRFRRRAFDGWGYYDTLVNFAPQLRTPPTCKIYAFDNSNGVSSNENTVFDVSSNTELLISTNPVGYISPLGVAVQNGDGTLTKDTVYSGMVIADAEIY